jgi:DNA-directed RNA polymerase subunit alpha
MISLPLPPKIIQKKKNTASFEIEALYPGYGVTIGNAMRRVLLSSLEGVAVTELRIKGAAHEFATMSGVLEDTIMIMLQVKTLRFKIFEGETFKLELVKKGEGPVTGKDFKLPPQVKLANPEVHIATVTDKSLSFEMEVQIEKGIGYVPKDQLRPKKTEIGTMILDGIFTPIKNVNFQVENMRVGDRTDFDKLNLEIETDGTITPEDAFFQACDILLKHFNIIFQGGAASGSGEMPKEAVVEEKGADMDVSKTSVEELKIGTRTINALLDNGIKTVGGLTRKSEKDLGELEGMGDKAITEVKKALKKLGVELKQAE